FIFGLPSDRPGTFEATAAVAQRAGVAFAQFVMLTPFPGTVDFVRWEEEMAANMTYVDGIPLTRYWLIPAARRPKVYAAKHTMSADEVRQGAARAWDQFYSLRQIWQRAAWLSTMRERVLFVLISKLFRQMYASTGAATDSARMSRATQWARWLAKPTQRLFAASPLPDLQVPAAAPERPPALEGTTAVRSRG
ncbi:MAG: radical SAM protein, partial [Gemmatimonadota bacterium]